MSERKQSRCVRCKVRLITTDANKWVPRAGDGAACTTVNGKHGVGVVK
jgi:hypothetical protein